VALNQTNKQVLKYFTFQIMHNVAFHPYSLPLEENVN
jgi:hypothetical protein